MAIEADALRLYPGPVLTVGADGSFAAVNAVARNLIAVIEDGSTGADSLRERFLLTAERARQSGAAEIRTFAMPDTGRQIEITVLPAPGKEVESACLILVRDVTLETNVKSVLAESRGRFKDLVELAADFAWETDEGGRFSLITRDGAFGRSVDEVVGKNPVVFADADMLIDPDDLPFSTRTPVRALDVWCLSPAGKALCYQTSAIPVFEDGEWKGARGLCLDVTGERNAQAELARTKGREELAAYIISAIRNELDPDDMLRGAVTAIRRALSAEGCALFSVSGDGGEIAFAADDGIFPDMENVTTSAGTVRAREQMCVEDGDGWASISMPVRFHGTINGIVSAWRRSGLDAFSGEEKELLQAVEGQIGIALRQIEDQKELEKLSRTDPLTGLLNRRAFEESLALGIDRANRRGEEGALLYIDLDNFKPVNDRHGHEAGDTVLKRLAEMLESTVRPYDLIARLGGDEFALWMDATDQSDAVTKTEELMERFKPMIELSAAPDLPLSLSIGIAIYRHGVGETLDGLLSRADTAMYEKKHAGKGGYVIATPASIAESGPEARS